ncbi:MAG: DUF3108 domain-containing protein [Elusimicrobia bacterium]|nr:DUF3108 domain-containing protein [Elusimicrobiota bacterium]
MASKVKLSFCLCLIAVIFSAGNLSSKKEDLHNWSVGEKLTFSIRWGVVTCGYAHMEVKEKIQLSGRDTYRLVTTARSASFFDPFYKVRDRIESYLDVEKLHTVRYEQSNREGSYEKDLTIIYDHEHKVAYEYNARKDPEYKKGDRFDITDDIQDVLSSLYYLRTKDLEVGKKFEFDVGTGKRTWPLEIEVVREEKVKVPAGKFKTFVVIPRLRDECIFKAKGDLEVWVTADKKKHPVKMRSKIDIGSITAVLVEKKI